MAKSPRPKPLLSTERLSGVVHRRQPIAWAALVKMMVAVRHVVDREPFVGMGGVVFRWPMVPRGEVINNRNGKVVNLFRIPAAALPAVHAP